MRYKPYGEDRDTGSALVTDRKFTGQTEDEAAGLYWYASRAYDPATGRFVSPDPIVPDPTNPQSLNRYSYVYNNPLGYTDPTGHYNVKDDTAWYREYLDRHNQAPSTSDEAYRQASMEAALRGQDFSVEYWTGEIERAASNVADSVGRAASSVADSVGRAASSVADSANRALFDAAVSAAHLVHGPQAEAYGAARLAASKYALDQSEWNAVLHAYWSGTLTIDRGPAEAWRITYEYEQINMEEGQETIDLVMDTYNNQVGIDIASGLPLNQRNRSNLMDRILQAEREGILWKIVGEQLKPTSPVKDVLPLDVIASPNQFHQR